MNLTAEKLKKVCPYANIDRLKELVPFLNQHMSFFQINTPQRVWHFIAQAAHESMSFNDYTENLGYTAEQLMSLWPKIYPTLEIAKKYEKDPVKIANFTYKNYGGNGSYESGDGWKYFGRGIFMISLKDNYERASMAIFKDKRLLNNPELLATHEYASLSACWFWSDRHLNSLADMNNIRNITLKINGGLFGFNERQAFYNAAKMYIDSECFIVKLEYKP